jgi:hypothetical protein
MFGNIDACVKEVLGETYNGTIVSDFFSAYIKYANKLQQFCLAHLIRDIKFLTTRPNQNDLVIDRRITQGSRFLMGRQWNARIWTVLDTCRKQGRSAWKFLQNALSAYYFQSSAPSLLPQA